MKLLICPRCKSEYPTDHFSPEEVESLKKLFKHENLGCELCMGTLDRRRFVKFTAEEVRKCFPAEGGFNDTFHAEKYGYPYPYRYPPKEKGES